LDYDHPMSPYDKRSAMLLEYAQGLKALPVSGILTLEKALSIMSIWRSVNVLVGANYDEQNTLNLEGTLEISYGRKFYGFGMSSARIATTSKVHQNLHQNRIGKKNLEVNNFHGDSHQSMRQPRLPSYSI